MILPLNLLQGGTTKTEAFVDALLRIQDEGLGCPGIA